MSIAAVAVDRDTLPDLLKVDEAAAIARCTGRYISMLCQTGAIQAVKLGKGWRISKNSFFDYLGIGR